MVLLWSGPRGKWGHSSHLFILILKSFHLRLQRNISPAVVPAGGRAWRRAGSIVHWEIDGIYWENGGIETTVVLGNGDIGSQINISRIIIFVKIIKIVKICRFWATLESCQLVKHCSIWTNFVLLNSHMVDLPRAIKKCSQKFLSAPVWTRKIWFARKMQN